MKIFIVTTNENKFGDIKKIMNKHGVEVKQINFEYPEIQGSLEEIVSQGAKYCSTSLNKTVLVHDAGLFIESLNGFPGVYIKYFLEKIGNHGILKLLENFENRNAEFRCAVGFCKPNSKPLFLPE